jgi:nucleotide-binding universal stress UspA family protein
MKRFLVGLDGSALAEAALPLAEQLARASAGTVILVRAVGVGEVLEPFEDSDPTIARIAIPRTSPSEEIVLSNGEAAEARDYLEAIARQLRDQGIAAETVVLPGEPADVLADEARFHHADAIILTTHGRSGFGRWLFGSVAESVLQTSPVPVLLVRGAMAHRAFDRSPAGLRLVVPLDGTPMSESILPVASDLALSLGAEIDLVQIVPSSPAALTKMPIDFGMEQPPRREDKWEAAARFNLKVVAHRLRSHGIPVRMTVGNDHPPAGIVAAAEAADASMIVMATHGRRGLGRALLGSVALDVLRRSNRPVLLVRASEAAATNGKEMSAAAR